MREVSLWVTEIEGQIREAEIPTIDLDLESYRGLLEAAHQSKWIPKEYSSNDWIADVKNFLIEGHPKPEFTPEMASAAAKHIQKISRNMGAGALALEITAGPSATAASKFPGVREAFWKDLFEAMVNTQYSNEQISALQDRRNFVANAAFAEYDFATQNVLDASGWEFTSPGREMTRKVYVDCGPNKPSQTVNFIVTFSNTESSSLEDVYALHSETGEEVGRWPSQVRPEFQTTRG